MSSLSVLLVKVTDYMGKSFVQNSLKSLGIGLVTHTAVYTLINTGIGYVRTSLGQLGEFFYALNIAGIDAFLSIIICYITVKAYLKSKNISFGRK